MSVFDRHQDRFDTKIIDHVRARIMEMAEIIIAGADPDGIKFYLRKP